MTYALVILKTLRYFFMLVKYSMYVLILWIRFKFWIKINSFSIYVKEKSYFNFETNIQRELCRFQWNFSYTLKPSNPFAVCTNVHHCTILFFICLIWFILKDTFLGNSRVLEPGVESKGLRMLLLPPPSFYKTFSKVISMFSYSVSDNAFKFHLSHKIVS